MGTPVEADVSVKLRDAADRYANLRDNPPWVAAWQTQEEVGTGSYTLFVPFPPVRISPSYELDLETRFISKSE